MPGSTHRLLYEWGQSRAMCPVRLHLKQTSDGQLALEWPNWAHSAHGRALTSLLQSCAYIRHSKQSHQGIGVSAGFSLSLAVNVFMKHP
jgi:hypothetical protein